MLKLIANIILTRAEKRVGVKLDYAREILDANFGLFTRYGKLFSFLDPVKHVPTEVYHAARLAGALSADCGSCVKAEINLAKEAGVNNASIESIVNRDFERLDNSISAPVRLAFAVSNREDDAISRDEILRMYGKNGLIELAYAMNGASLLPGIKRALGHATSCDISTLSKEL